MSGPSGADLVTKAKKYREVETIAHESVPNVAETLETISKFLQDHETPGLADCTHMVFDNFGDWWQHSKSSCKLAIAEDNTLDMLHKHISTLYDLGIPLTLTEKRTPEIRFIQDIEILGTRDDKVSVEEILDPATKLMNVLGRAMGEIYTTQTNLIAAVFDSTGVCRTKGVMKTSVKIVWSNIIVDKDRAARIHDFVVHKFKECQDQEVKDFSARVTGYNTENHWGGIFSDAIYFGRFGVRMPLCDRVSPAPLKKPEQRPFKPVALLQFNFADNQLAEVKRLDEQPEGFQWVQIGCIRRDVGTPLTDWTPPTWQGQRAPRPQSSAAYSNGGGGGGGGG
eukprot:CAMPEP_0194495684 /NCGR_PEP_ID=MMETSP0253-20130528/13199_1 /TAXON_ID=2966 /ORGANISM="Noctiluca scintillans" /LENGTH=337 /DNA_ID=CAMNT_0039336977 /DNA_START=77 /DNA_END=1087 /DNA_ORIENTATION=-